MGVNVTTASNISNTVGKWEPYYYKPFSLGRTDDGSESSDGNIYITQTTGTSSQSLSASCTSSVNCNFYYTLTFLDTGAPGAGSAFFYVTKYTLNHREVDTIFASETGPSDDGKWWYTSSFYTITIDVGVNVLFPIMNVHDDDVYKITLPSTDTMDKRRIYHGGYSSFLRMPETEGKAYHSDIIPTSLNGKNLTVLFNPHQGFI